MRKKRKGGREREWRYRKKTKREEEKKAKKEVCQEEGTGFHKKE